MTNQYFEKNPTTDHNRQIIDFEFYSNVLNFMTDSGTFSKHRIDYGSKVLMTTFVEQVTIDKSQQVLELGSGYGPITIALAKVFPMIHMTGIEINQRAYELAIENSQKNGVNNVTFLHEDVCQFNQDKTYHHVLTNPPIRAGKNVIQKFVNIAHSHLTTQGKLWVVIQKKQGAPSMQKHMQEIFGNVEKVMQDKGYWILVSEKI